MPRLFHDDDLLAWVVPEGESPDVLLVAQLHQAGLAVCTCAPGQSGGLDATLRLIDTRCFADAAAVLREWAGSDLPTLIAAADADDEARWLARVDTTDDVAVGTTPGTGLIRRLARLSSRIRTSARTLPPDAAGAAPPGLLDKEEWTEMLALRLNQLTAQPDGHCHAVALLDVDRMDELNTAHGHLAGDQLLRTLAERALRGCRPDDLVGRYDGDCFALLLRRYDAATLERDMRQLLARLEDGVAIDADTTARITLCAALCPLTSRAGFDEVLDRLDHVLRTAKRAGGHLLLIDAGAGAQPPAGRATPLDPLTLAHTRAHLNDRLSRECERANHRGHPLSVALIDVQGLSAINERHGHRAGDTVLRHLAELLRQGARSTDWLARHQGGCFALVMPDASQEHMQHVNNRLVNAAADAPFTARSGVVIPLRFTLAAATHQAGMTAAALLQQAEAALQAERDARSERQAR